MLLRWSVAATSALRQPRSSSFLAWSLVPCLTSGRRFAHVSPCSITGVGVQIQVVLPACFRRSSISSSDSGGHGSCKFTRQEVVNVVSADGHRGSSAVMDANSTASFLLQAGPSSFSWQAMSEAKSAPLTPVRVFEAVCANSRATARAAAWRGCSLGTLLWSVVDWNERNSSPRMNSN